MKLMNKIKFVYFDVGGVLVVDFTNTNKMAELKKDLGVTASTEEAFEAVWQKYRNRICLDCDVDKIMPELQEKTGLLFPNDYSMLKDFVGRFEQNPSIWPILNLVKQKAKIGLLTNQYPRMLKEIENSNLIPHISWDAIVDSSAVGYQKPEEKIFEIAEKESGVKPEEILFVDNLARNTEAASKRGWQVFVYDDQNMESASGELLKILL